MGLIYYPRWLDWEKLQLRPQFRRLEEEQGNGKRNEGRGREGEREGPGGVAYVLLLGMMSRIVGAQSAADE